MESREASATFLHPLPSSGSIRRHSDPDEVSGIHVVPCDAMEMQGLGIWGLCGEGVHSGRFRASPMLRSCRQLLTCLKSNLKPY